jgi:hypothetical protein
MAPTEAPHTTSGTMPALSSACSTDVRPARAEPLPRAKPMRGRMDGWVMRERFFTGLGVATGTDCGCHA